MTYYGAKELASSFRTVRKNTMQIAQDIPEFQYGFRAAPDTRNIEKLLTHIALAYRFQLQMHSGNRRSSLEGFDFPAYMKQVAQDEAKPRTKAEVIELLKAEGEAWAAFVEGMPESVLAESVTMPQGASPASRSRLDMINSGKEHEMHHRGQLMLMQRMIGIVPHLTREFQARFTQSQAQAGAAKP